VTAGSELRGAMSAHVKNLEEEFAERAEKFVEKAYRTGFRGATACELALGSH